MKLRFLLPSLILLTMLAHATAHAAETAAETPEKAAPVVADSAKTDVKAEDTLKVPDTSNILFLQNLRRIGSTIYYLGESLGLHGWLVVKDKQIQILYTTPDQRAVLVGALLTAEGANISQQQMMVLASNKKEIADILQLGDPANIKLSDNKAREKALRDVQVPEGKSTSDVFFDELKKLTMLTFGKSTAPPIYMIMDVNCGHCHAAWKKLEPFIDAGALRVSMIPTGAMGLQSESDATNWLNNKDPLDAWRKYVAGDKNILKIGALDPDKADAVNSNTKFVYKWKIQQTPTLVYQGKNGKVRMIVGVPENTETLLQDIAIGGL